MKTRHVFSTPDLVTARGVIAAARSAGTSDEGISLVARSDIEMDSIPDEQLEVTTDTVPNALRGTGVGAAVGLVAGIVAVAVPAVGITIAGAGLMTLLGAGIGGWSSGLAGASFPNAIRQEFEAEIASGRILVVVDVGHDLVTAVDEACLRAGATKLPFEQLSALT